VKVHGNSDRGIPILSLRDKVESLLYCLEMEQDGPLREDAMGHLFDLIHHIAPGYEFGKLKGIAAIQAVYGSHPTPIVEDSQ
jgi:hypothetical protein